MLASKLTKLNIVIHARNKTGEMSKELNGDQAFVVANCPDMSTELHHLDMGVALYFFPVPSEPRARS